MRLERRARAAWIPAEGLRIMNACWHDARRILCVRLDNLGGVLMTTPAIRALKAAHPDRHITLLTSPAGEAVAKLVPDVDTVIVFDAPWMKGGAPRETAPADDEAVQALLRAGNFDAAVIFTAHSQSALPAAYLCYRAGIPLRLARCRENPRELLTDWVAEREPGKTIRHEVRRQLDLVAAVGCLAEDQRMSFAVHDRACRAVRRMLGELGLDFGRPWVLLHGGASAASRRYPPPLFARVVRLLAEAGCQTVLAGSPDEADDVAAIQRMAGVPTLSVAGRLDLAGLGAAILLADVVICNNSGPAHLAAAIGTPLVELYALTEPQHAPWMVRHVLLFHDVPCRFCYESTCPQGHHDCLRRVAPARVAQAALALLPFGMRWMIAAIADPPAPVRLRSVGPSAPARDKLSCVGSAS